MLRKWRFFAEAKFLVVKSTLCCQKLSAGFLPNWKKIDFQPARPLISRNLTTQKTLFPFHQTARRPARAPRKWPLGLVTCSLPTDFALASFSLSINFTSTSPHQLHLLFHTPTTIKLLFLRTIGKCSLTDGLSLKQSLIQYSTSQSQSQCQRNAHQALSAHLSNAFKS